MKTTVLTSALKMSSCRVMDIFERKKRDAALLTKHLQLLLPPCHYIHSTVFHPCHHIHSTVFHLCHYIHSTVFHPCHYIHSTVVHRCHYIHSTVFRNRGSRSPLKQRLTQPTEIEAHVAHRNRGSHKNDFFGETVNMLLG